MARRQYDARRWGPQTVRGGNDIDRRFQTTYRQAQADRRESRMDYETELAMAERYYPEMARMLRQRSGQAEQDIRTSTRESAGAQRLAAMSHGGYNPAVAGSIQAGAGRYETETLNRYRDAMLQQEMGYKREGTQMHMGTLARGPRSVDLGMLSMMHQSYENQKQFERATKGPNKSWSNWLSNFYAPGAIESRAMAVLNTASSMAGGGANFQSSDPYYNQGGQQAQAAAAQTGGNAGGVKQGGGGAGGMGVGGGTPPMATQSAQPTQQRGFGSYGQASPEELASSGWFM